MNKCVNKGSIQIGSHVTLNKYFSILKDKIRHSINAGSWPIVFEFHASICLL